MATQVPTSELPHQELDPKYDADLDYPTTAPVKQNGHPGYLTEEQEATLYLFRMKLEAAGYTERLDTLTLLRFLRARKFDVALAETMFIDCEKWRRDFGLDDLVRNFDYKEKEEMMKYYPQYYHKTDKDGRPVYIEQLGLVDLTAMYKITTPERMLQNLAVEYEKVGDPRLPACSRKAGKLLETCCTIMDLKGVGLSKFGSVRSYIGSASSMSQNYYPERLGRLYLINAPWGFSTIFGLIKGFLDPVTVEKIHVLGSGYQQQLLAQIPPENLPSEFGGHCECPGGCMLSDEGPWKDPEWTRPPKWQQKQHSTSEKAQDVIDNTVGGTTTKVATYKATPDAEVDAAPATHPAPAAA